MMATGGAVKRVLERMPLTAELDMALRGRERASGGFKLEELRAALPEWVAAAENSPLRQEEGQKVLVYATLHYWLNYACLVGLALNGMGHEVTLAYSPFNNWQKPVAKYDMRKRELYVRDVLEPARNLLNIETFTGTGQRETIDAKLIVAIDAVSTRDVQYSLQVESVDTESELYKLRQDRNYGLAQQALQWLQREEPDVVIVPNGLILEFGALQAVCEHLGIPVVSYEFGEQQERIWLARDRAVMLQDTDAMWEVKRDEPFSAPQKMKVKELFAARQQADLFSNFYRKWQDVPSEGAQKAKENLELDDRPIVLLAANVIGDSLTLGRAIFSENMSDWLQRSLEFFAKRDDLQLVIRIHPGERNLPGPSVADLVADQLPELPENMRVVAAMDPINTYDLIQAADLGLVYTTTVGLEMAMSGLPSIVVGQTHYRAKGFTRDPQKWTEYFAELEGNLSDLKGARLSNEQVEMAWHYAYCFFFEYPQLFPWHLLHFKRDAKDYPLAKLFTAEGQAQYRKSFDILTGKAFAWEQVQ